VHKAAVGAHRQKLDVERLELVILGGDRRQFCRSNKGEISRVKADHDPLPLIVRELDGLESHARDKGARLKIGGLLANACSHLTLLGWCSPCSRGGGL
jgi:hypothetical protein